MLVSEVTTKPQSPMTPAQARVAALKKAERKRQKVQAAQARLQKAAAGSL